MCCTIVGLESETRADIEANSSTVIVVVFKVRHIPEFHTCVERQILGRIEAVIKTDVEVRKEA